MEASQMTRSSVTRGSAREHAGSNVEEWLGSTSDLRARSAMSSPALAPLDVLPRQSGSMHFAGDDYAEPACSVKQFNAGMIDRGARFG
mmetsp:Transcript_50659/g.118359  ORF Transcript_50659/g.118359 Transcript_50659/m.118359 type:complete len:88 (+) Transcript_50659:67-330(+)|eukprot:5694537-Amphidinium_carterae.3